MNAEQSDERKMNGAVILLPPWPGAFMSENQFESSSFIVKFDCMWR